MNAWEFLRDLNTVCHFQTREGKKVGEASNSELKRWIQNKALVINESIVVWDAAIPSHLYKVTLFSKERKITLL